MTPPTSARNVLGGELQLCCLAPRTGFLRDGFCCTGPDDLGLHTVCAQMTEEFLAGIAPPVFLAATHENALVVVELDELQAHAVEPQQ